MRKVVHRRFQFHRSIVAALVLASSTVFARAAQHAHSDPRLEEISAAFPYESKFVVVKGSRLHYVEQGTGDPILFLHGNPTSSYLWRNIIPYVSPVGRAIALDLVGFGKSDKPPIGYTYQEHLAYVEGFIEALQLKNITFVVHDWGSVLGLDYASRHTDNVRGVAFMEAIIPPAFPSASYDALGAGGALFRRFRTPDEGRRLIIDQNCFVEVILGRGALTRKLTEQELNAYRAPFLDPPSRFPIYVWPSELPIEGVPARNVAVIERIGAWLKISNTPKLLLYASPGAIISPETATWMGEHYRNIETVFVGHGRHYIQEDDPESIGRNIADWYRRVLHNTKSRALSSQAACGPIPGHS